MQRSAAIDTRAGQLADFKPLPATRGEILEIRDTFEQRFPRGAFNCFEVMPPRRSRSGSSRRRRGTFTWRHMAISLRRGSARLSGWETARICEAGLVLGSRGSQATIPGCCLVSPWPVLTFARRRTARRRHPDRARGCRAGSRVSNWPYCRLARPAWVKWPAAKGFSGLQLAVSGGWSAVRRGQLVVGRRRCDSRIDVPLLREPLGATASHPGEPCERRSWRCCAANWVRADSRAAPGGKACPPISLLLGRLRREHRLSLTPSTSKPLGMKAGRLKAGRPGTSEHAVQVIWASSFRRILDRQVAQALQYSHSTCVAVGLPPATGSARWSCGGTLTTRPRYSQGSLSPILHFGGRYGP